METMTESQYLVLLRGINVGGNNIIKMADLKACFESMGFVDVVTYIQSGNVVFKAAEKDKAKLTTKIESVLSERFSYKSRLVTVAYKELKKVVEDAPKGFGKDLDQYRCDVIFLKEPLTVKEAMKNVRVREGVDNAYAGKTVLYFSRLTSRASQSYLTKIITLPMYQNMTIRNWNTTTKLLALMEAGNGKSKSKEAN
jgi:uncharacterized protein (DUF1697 family)